MSNPHPAQLVAQAIGELRALYNDIIPCHNEENLYDYVRNRTNFVSWRQSQFALARAFLQRRKDIFTKYEKLIMGLEKSCTAAGIARVQSLWRDVQEALQTIMGLWQYRQVIRESQMAELATGTVPYFEWAT